MRNYILSFFILLGFIGGFAVGCGDEGSGIDCQAGTEMCVCAENNMCFAGLMCSSGTCFPDNTTGSDSTGDDTDTGNDDTTGGGSVPNENVMCARLDECNYLEAGVSATDCADTIGVCTADLISSAYADWNNEALECLELSNCKNLKDCLSELPDCSPAGGTDDGSCVADGMPCDYCWSEVCPLEYLGGLDGCDCGCTNGPDPDCG